MGGSETLFGHVVYYKDGGEMNYSFQAIVYFAKHYF